MGGLSRAVNGLRAVLRPASADADLLRAFVATRDEAAFGQLVGRHGPLVLGVCRRVYLPAADDAFQATFLLLALKAGTLRDPAGVAGWLHGVAVRTSREAKAMAARRRLVERLAARPEAAPPPPDAEALALLDAAVAGLPARYRAAVVLCDLAEKTRAEAAAELGVPEGTVASRLARGRKLLAAKLAGKGLVVPLVVGGACPSSALVASTVQTGVLLAAGGAVPPAVSLLVTGVTRAMSGSVLKPVLAAGLVAVGVGGAWGWQAGDGPKPADPPPAVAAKPKAETPAEQWKRLKAEFEAEKKANTKPALDPKTGQPLQPRSYEVRMPPATKYADRLLELGRCDDAATAAAALTLAALEFTTTKLSDEAFDLLIDRFADDGQRLASYARGQIGRGFDRDYQRAERLLGVSADPYVRAYSTLKLAYHYRHRYADGPAVEARAAVLLQRITADYPVVDGGHVARWAERELGNMLTLRAGRPAPPLSGPDLDGKPMDLADFKGRVVVFYPGSSKHLNWPDNLPWLKELHAEYGPRGLTVVGLMSEYKAEDAVAAAKKHAVPWRSWVSLFDEHRESPVEKAWGIRTPTSLIVIDRAGVIRHPDLRTREQVEAAIIPLLAEK